MKQRKGSLSLFLMQTMAAFGFLHNHHRSASTSSSAVSLLNCQEGYFPCNNSEVCVEQKNFCDQKRDCQDGSDEWDCDDVRLINFMNTVYRKRPDEDREKKKAKCELKWIPDPCWCSKYSVFCDNFDLLEIPTNISEQSTELDISGNQFEIIEAVNFTRIPSLKTLIVNTGFVQSIGLDTFRYIPNLINLYLTSNRITSLENGCFVSLTKLELLVLSYNPLSVMAEGAFQGLLNLRELDLRTCQISDLHPNVFKPLLKLEKLWLQENKISQLPQNLFESLKALETLSLYRNNFSEIPTLALSDLPGLGHLSLAGNKIYQLEEGDFYNLSKLHNLDLNNNRLTIFHLKVFVDLPSLETLSLRGNPFQALPSGIFDHLKNLQHIYMPQFTLCSFAPRIRDCEPKSDGISSTDNMLENPFLRLSVWLVALASCMGNLFVLIGRLMMKEPNEVHSFYIRNLSVADFLMGVYLFAIAIQDIRFRGDYIHYDRRWRKNWYCHLLGSICAVSSEASVFILAVITVDRYVSVTYPLALRRRTSKISFLTMGSSWLLAIFLAFLPWTRLPYFSDNFYGQNAACLPLHIHEPFAPGWQYSLFVFCGLNSVAFLVIAAAYVKMFITIVRSRLGLRSSQQQQERTIAKRFAFIVGTDFVCWCPIIFIKFYILAGYTVDNTLYGWIAIFILPVNAALNPVLYTMTTRLFKQNLERIVFTWRSPPLPPEQTSAASISSVFYIKGANRLHITTISDVRHNWDTTIRTVAGRHCCRRTTAYERRLLLVQSGTPCRLVTSPKSKSEGSGRDQNDNDENLVQVVNFDKKRSKTNRKGLKTEYRVL